MLPDEAPSCAVKPGSTVELSVIMLMA